MRIKKLQLPRYNLTPMDFKINSSNINLINEIKPRTLQRFMNCDNFSVPINHTVQIPGKVFRCIDSKTNELIFPTRS